MCTVKLSPAARDASVQFSVCDPTAPVIEHVAAPVAGTSIDQPAAVVPAGSGSFTVTPVAVPGPELDTLMPNPSGSPAFTVPLSAVFTMWIDAVLQVMLAKD